MMLPIRFTQEGKERLHELHIENQRRIKSAVKELSRNPYAGKSLTGKLEGLFSLRVGKYRVLYSVDGEMVVIHTVGHRREVYK